MYKFKSLLSSVLISCFAACGGGTKSSDDTDSSMNDNDSSLPMDDGAAGDGAVEVPRVIQLALGGSFACVLMPSGKVYCWGKAGDGNLGYANSEDIGDNESATSVGPVDLPEAAIQITAGYIHACAILESGGVRCWGNNSQGQLGYSNLENIGDNETPADVPNDVGIGGKAVRIAAGFYHTCVVLDTGDVRCWGANQYGALGDPNVDPPAVVGDNEVPSYGTAVITGAAIDVTAGEYHTCIMTTERNVVCWGDNTSGILGYASTVTAIGDDEAPAVTNLVQVGGTVSEIKSAAAADHTCVLRQDGKPKCWGYGGLGQNGVVGTITIGDNETPDMAGSISLGGNASHIAVGSAHTCAVLENSGSVRCWGYNLFGQLGYGNTTSGIGSTDTPSQHGPVDLGADTKVIAIAAGTNFTCAALENNDVYCWGLNDFGQLGYGMGTDTIGDDEAPTFHGPLVFPP